MEIVFDQVCGILDPDSIRSVVNEKIPEVSSLYLEIWMRPLYENAKKPGQTFGTEIYDKDFTKNIISKAIHFWQSKGLLKKIGPSALKLKYPNIKEALPGNYKYTESAISILRYFEEIDAEPTDYELARILHWRPLKKLRIPVIGSILRECCSLEGQLSVLSIEKEVILRIKENANLAEAKETIYKEYVPYVKAMQLKNRFGAMNPEPSDEEVQMYVKWSSEWGFTDEQISSYAERTALGTPSFLYLNGILHNVYTENMVSNEHWEELKIILQVLGVPSSKAKELKLLYAAIRKKYAYGMVFLSAHSVANIKQKRSLMDVYHLLEEWDKERIRNEEDVKEYLELREKAVKVINMINSENNLNIEVNKTNVKKAMRWIRDLRMTEDEILNTAGKIKDPVKPINYIDKSLTAIYKERLQTLKEMIEQG